MKEFVRQWKFNYIINAAITVVIGVVLIAWPKASLDVACKAMGAVLLLTGLSIVVMYFLRRQQSFLWSASLGIGVLIAVLGVWIILNPSFFEAIVPMVSGIIILFSGCSNIVQAFTLLYDHDPYWWVALIFGLITVILALLLIFNPLHWAEAIVRIIGVFMVFDGLSDLWILLRVHRAAKRIREEADALTVEAKVIEEQPEEPEDPQSL